MVGAATGALLLAFSDSYWENSIEAEVYSLMSLAQIFIFDDRCKLQFQDVARFGKDGCFPAAVALVGGAVAFYVGKKLRGQ